MTSIKLYGAPDSPPSLAVHLCLKALNIPFEYAKVNYINGDHMKEEYTKMNPQKEFPVLDDDGFYLSESIAILQYLCDKYAPENQLYPTDPKQRAIVNHRLCFNSMFYYPSIGAYALMPIYFDYERTPMGLKKLHISLQAFNTYLERLETKYAAGDHLTIADLALVSATIGLEAVKHGIEDYPLVYKWYENFKSENPELWAIAEESLKLFEYFEENPPDLSTMNHPIHPTRKNLDKIKNDGYAF